MQNNNADGTFCVERGTFSTWARGRKRAKNPRLAHQTARVSDTDLSISLFSLLLDPF